MPQDKPGCIIWIKGHGGSHRYGSDIDIALDGDDLTIDDLLKLHTRIEDLNLPFFVDLVHIQRIENPDLIDHINRVGRVLYSCDKNHLEKSQ
jgi:uncharacterized protein